MKLIGNTSLLIDWDAVIEKCKKANGSTMWYNHRCFPDTEDFRQLDKLWQQAGYLYKDHAIEWTNYFKEDFGEEVVEKFKDIVNVEPLLVWISKIRPGKMAPWHFDANQHIDEYKKKGELVRYTCYIQEPQHGHISIVGESALYRPQRGNIYRWPSYDAWHCGMNGGLTDKYMFNYWGYL